VSDLQRKQLQLAVNQYLIYLAQWSSATGRLQTFSVKFENHTSEDKELN